MKQLKVSWADGVWQPFADDGSSVEQPIATATIPAKCAVAEEGGALVFKYPGSPSQVYLVVPVSRFISAVEIPEEGQ